MWIEERIYQIIKEKMPIPTVDAIIVHEDKFLLLKRKNPPVKGEWWLPGGRIRKGETLKEAVKREVREETGLECKVVRQVGVIEQFFPEVHTVSVFYLLESDSPEVKLNKEHSEYRWVSKLPENAHQYVKTMVEKTGLPT